MSAHLRSHSSITSVGYGPATQILEIEFGSGDIYQYYGVTPTAYLDIAEGASKDIFIKDILSKYEYQRVDGSSDIQRLDLLSLSDLIKVIDSTLSAPKGREEIKHILSDHHHTQIDWNGPNEDLVPNLISELLNSGGKSIFDTLKPGLDPRDQETISKLTSVELRSERAVDYKNLEFLLRNHRWKEADYETGVALLSAAGKQKSSFFLGDEEIKSLPCVDIETIDLLWRQYSQGRFGFSVQKSIYARSGNMVNGRSTGEQTEKNLIEFGKLVGWRKQNGWIRYSDLDFSITAPQGHLPVTPLYRSTIVGAIGYMVPLLDPMIEAVSTLLFSSEEKWPDLGNEWGLWWRLLYAQIDRCEASGFFVRR